MPEKNRSRVETALMEAIRCRAGEVGHRLERELRGQLESLVGQGLESVRLHFGSDGLLDVLGARAACWRHHVFMRSDSFHLNTIAHEIAHAAQWLRFGERAREGEGSISDSNDLCEQEAAGCARLAGLAAAKDAIGVAHACSADLMLDDSWESPGRLSDCWPRQPKVAGRPIRRRARVKK